MVVEGEPRRWQKAWNALFPTIWRAFLKYASYLWRERKLRWAGHWNVCLRLFCFIQRCFVYVCVDYKSLPRHRGFWEKLESERKGERDLNEILFSGGTQLGNIRTHWAAHACERTHTHRCILRLRNTHGNTMRLLHRSKVVWIVIFLFFFHSLSFFPFCVLFLLYVLLILDSSISSVTTSFLETFSVFLKCFL